MFYAQQPVTMLVPGFGYAIALPAWGDQAVSSFGELPAVELNCAPRCFPPTGATLTQADYAAAQMACRDVMELHPDSDLAKCCAQCGSATPAQGGAMKFAELVLLAGLAWVGYRSYKGRSVMP